MEKIRLDAFCSSVRDGTHDTPKPVESGRYLVTSKAIRNNSVFLDECYFISQSDFDQINKRSLVEKWDVLMTMIGSVGRLLLVKNQPNYAIKNIALFKVGEEIKAKWLYYYLSNPSVQNYFELIASGTSQHFIGLGHLRKLRIDDINDSSEKIVSILSAYDNLIENNNRRIRLLEQMTENLNKEWFVRFRFPGHEKVEMENGLPKGWNIAPLSSEYNTTSGGTPSRTNMSYYSGSIPWIKTGELQGTFILDTEEHITEEAVRKSSAKLIPAYSLLIAMYAGANVGNLGINSTLATCNQACCVITTKGRYPLYYLLYFLQTQKGFLQSISFGAAQQNISQDIIKKLKVLLPPIELCETFNKIVSPYLQQCELLMKQNSLLTRQRDLLLPRLMSGKLEVNA